MTNFCRAALLALALQFVSGASFAQQIAPHIGGAWDPLGPWPIIAIHAVLTPGGNVLTYGSDAGGKATGRFIYDIWDASKRDVALGHTTLPNGTGTDIFCGAQLLLPQGDVFLAGGDTFVDGETTQTGNSDANVFTPADNALNRAGSMQRARWYASVTSLPNGDTYIQGGTGGDDRAEVRATDGTFRLLPFDTTPLDHIYPRNFLAPDGRIFGIDIAGNMYFVAADLSSLTAAGTVDVTGGGSSAVMYAPGKILHMGGNSDAALMIDINSGTPQVTPTANLATRRDLMTATVLADGRVLATGGSAEYNQAVGINNSAAIWDPASGQWSIGPDGATPRLYHSIALLLPDASVLVAGGGAPGPVTNTNAEIYHPPYLFDAAGPFFAARPQITAAPANIVPGKTFEISVGASDSVTRVSLIRTGSVTHSWNMDQRYTELAFTQSGATLTLTAPANANLMPPGYYLLFALNGAGVPSIAKIVKAEIAAAAQPEPPPPEPTPPAPPATDSGGAPSPAPNPPPAAPEVNADGGGGCTATTHAAIDASLVLLLLGAACARPRRARRLGAHID